MTLPGPVMLDLKSTDISAEEKEKLTHPSCGGVILFARNIASPKQVSELNQSIRNLNSSLLIAVDQEGGRVQRLKDGYSLLPALRLLEQQAQDHDQALLWAYHHGRLMALEVIASGFDISFAPVLDLASEDSRVIGDRAFHENVEAIIPLAQAYIRGMGEAGMKATGKHFPGHGTVHADSHVEIPEDDRPFETIMRQDLRVFAELSPQLAAVMPAHVIYSQVDSQPAGFSPHWIQEILRRRLSFEGVVFSDDLSMKGAETAGDYCQRAESALEAGCDMVLVCNQPEEAENVLEFCEQYPFAEDSAKRIQSMKASGTKLALSQLAELSPMWRESHQILAAQFAL
ncbi:beta-N-acetylhexosaminidase [Pleionea sp. CnH1-48]|uniref:beta-N-acetylhexosaminidase n=1 Tax=Pleionea sp. CnH1-48 TaxID=2954494 RepID=UPI0020969620|nr:beta-N-acetylhexosaminidase [Pleionea sp. CnH1-48]MCO7225842.1 beta-N-acetylhexosaminidase [Pleionea sp. CnH1-48]